MVTSQEGLAENLKRKIPPTDNDDKGKRPATEERVEVQPPRVDQVSDLRSPSNAPTISELVGVIPTHVRSDSTSGLKPFAPAFKTDNGKRVTDIAEGRDNIRVSRAIVANMVLPKDFEAIADQPPEAIENELFHSEYRVRTYTFSYPFRL